MQIYRYGDMLGIDDVQRNSWGIIFYGDFGASSVRGDW